MPFRKREPKHEYKVQNIKISENLTEQLLNLKDTFTQVLNSVCSAIDKDCGYIGNDEKAKELERIKQKYSNLREEVGRIISEFTLASPVSKEETAAVQEGLTQCMSYLSRVHRSMESVLRKYEDNENSRCCSKQTPHLHKEMHGNHVIIPLNKGTQSEVDYVNRLMDNMNSLPEEKRKKVFNKIYQRTDSEEELGGGDDLKRHNSILDNGTMNLLSLRKKQINPIIEDNQPCSFISSFTQKVSSVSSCRISENVRGVQESPKQEPCQNWYFPETIMESLLAGYSSWLNGTSEINSQVSKKYNIKVNKRETDNEGKKKINLIGNGSGDKEVQQNVIEELSSIPHVYDSKGNPLTDSKGAPLKNIFGDYLVKFENMKPVSTLNGEPVFDKNNLPFVISLDKPLYNVNGDPLRLYNQDGIPLTDEDGYVLKLLNGRFSVYLDHYNRIHSDAFERPLFNSSGQPVTSQMESTCTKQSNMKSTIASVHPLLYNENGFLLTNSNGTPLNDPQGNPLIMKDQTSEKIKDSNDHPIYDSEGKMYSKFSKTKSLALYNCNKYPLTADNGTVLRNVEGQPMVLFDKKGNPISDCLNREIYDADGNSSNSPRFNPYVKQSKRRTRSNINIGEQVYDFRGYPLVDHEGYPLSTSDGKQLLVCNDKGDIAHDLNGYPVFDKAGIPLNRINGGWITPQGQPYRVFNSEGFPLTSERGEDLFDISGKKLIKLDQRGRPVETVSGSLVCDASGTPASHAEFNPSQTPPNTIMRKVYMYNKPMKVYNKDGQPLTDISGVAMVDGKGRDLIQFDERGIPAKDAFGQTIFDEYKIPLNCRPGKRIISMSEKPFRIYDKHGRPLTDINGTPLNLANSICTIKFDNAGRPISDFRNSELYDFNGKILQDPLANPEGYRDREQLKIVKNGQSLQVYNSEGMPLIDKNGIMLVNSNGTHLRLNKERYPMSDWNGDPLYNENGQSLKIRSTMNCEESERNTDAFGRLIKDARGEPQFDKYGRPLYDLYRRRIYDDEGHPIANAYGKYLVTNIPESKDVDLGFDPIILNTTACLGIESLTDLIGGPLYDPSGMPLYNQYGKPLIDMYGRPLYDDEGLPLCDNTGKPVSELVRQNGLTVQVTDVYKLIEVSNEVADLIENTVVRSARTEVHPTSPGIWILPSNINSNDKVCSTTHPEKKLYWALLRITSFDDGKKSFEILEAKPYSPYSIKDLVDCE